VVRGRSGQNNKECGGRGEGKKEEYICEKSRRAGEEGALRRSVLKQIKVDQQKTVPVRKD
jgi:hypothetical protein